MRWTRVSPQTIIPSAVHRSEVKVLLFPHSFAAKSFAPKAPGGPQWQSARQEAFHVEAVVRCEGLQYLLARLLEGIIHAA